MRVCTACPLPPSHSQGVTRQERAPHSSTRTWGRTDMSSTPGNPAIGLQGEQLPKEGKGHLCPRSPLPELTASTPGALGPLGTRHTALGKCWPFSRKRLIVASDSPHGDPKGQGHLLWRGVALGAWCGLGRRGGRPWRRPHAGTRPGKVHVALG